MQRKKEYFGIYLNDDIPKLDKINKYTKEVTIRFEGKAFLIQRDEENEIRERIEIENNEKLKKEKDYEIEFVNEKNEIYNIQIRIEISYLFLLILLFLFIVILSFMFCKKASQEDSWLKQFCNYINLAMIKLDIKQEEMTSSDNEIVLEYDFKNKKPKDINLLDTIEANTIAMGKVAPGISGHFSIILSTKNSLADINYKINFVNIVSEQPTNMTFKIRGKNNKNYSTLQELEKELIGVLPKRSKKTIIIDWQWNYETGHNFNTIQENDWIDTKNGKNLKKYRFKIHVLGEEVI